MKGIKTEKSAHFNLLTVIGHLQNYFVKHHSDCAHKYPEVDINTMLEFLIDNIDEVFENQVFQQSVRFPMDIISAPITSRPIFVFI